MDRLGLSSSAIRLSIDSSFTGSTLSAVIKIRMSGSDNALLSVNSWLAVFMNCPLVVSGIYMRPRPDSQLRAYLPRRRPGSVWRGPCPLGFFRVPRRRAADPRCMKLWYSACALSAKRSVFSLVREARFRVGPGDLEHPWLCHGAPVPSEHVW